MLCELRSVSRSGLNAARQREPSKRSSEEEKLVKQLRAAQHKPYSLGSDLSIELACNEEYSARAHDPLLVYDDVAVGERQSTPLFLHVNMRLKQIAKLSNAGKIQREIGGDETGRRICGEGHGITEGNIRERCEYSAVYRSACIAVLCLDAKTEHKPCAFTSGVEGANQFRRRARAKKWFEVGRDSH